MSLTYNRKVELLVTFGLPTKLLLPETVNAIAEFIEVAIHTILYVRQVYPAELFVRRKKYDTPVFQSRHPALNEYISGAIKATKEEIALGSVDKVVVIIKDKDEVALERFIFSIQNMIQVEAYDKNTSVENAMSAVSLGQYFRSFLVKVNLMESLLGQLDLGDDASFAIVLELNDSKVPTASVAKEPPPWIPANDQDTTSGASEQAELHMLRAVNTGIINLSLAVQESDVKLNREKSKDSEVIKEQENVKHNH